MSPLALILLTFTVVVVAIIGIYWLVIARPETSEKRAIEKRLRPPEPANKKPRLVISQSELQQDSGFALLGPVRLLLIQAGLTMTMPAFIFASWMSGFGVGLVAFLGLRNLTFGLVAGGVAMLIPYMVIKFLASRRMWKFEEQFPEAIDLIARSLRAGHSFPNGLLMVADEISEPVGPEFKLIYDRQNFGMPLPEALRAFAKRIPVIDARFFVTAVLTQREAGGNLSGVLDNLSAVIRERFKVKRQISVISAHGRMTAAVLAGLPPFVAAAQAVITPQNFALMINDPLGQYMLIGAAVMQVVGMLVIRKIIQIPY